MNIVQVVLQMIFFNSLPYLKHYTSGEPLIIKIIYSSLSANVFSMSGVISGLKLAQINVDLILSIFLLSSREHNIGDVIHL